MRLAGVGNDIAHDLRTPLTRARLSLERGRTHATTLAQLQEVTDKAIAGIDQSLAIITALLRLTEIENSRRAAGFGNVALHEMLREVCDVYEPIAEDKNIELGVDIDRKLYVWGDRDLLFEAIANLVDNAVKFTPGGGKVDLELSRGEKETIVRVTDTGPGIRDRYTRPGARGSFEAILSLRQDAQHAGRWSRAEPGRGDRQAARLSADRQSRPWGPGRNRVSGRNGDTERGDARVSRRVSLPMMDCRESSSVRGCCGLGLS